MTQREFSTRRRRDVGAIKVDALRDPVGRGQMTNRQRKDGRFGENRDDLRASFDNILVKGDERRW
jgi:hypothetical protein